MEKKNIIQEFDQTFTDLLLEIEKFDQQNFNQVPFDGSWTAGQTVQHIVLSGKNFADALNGEVKDTAGPIDEWVAKLKAILLDFNRKMDSPDFIRPELQDYDPEELLTKIAKIKAEVSPAIAQLDLSKTCLAFELPGIGLVTRLEAIYFLVYHTQRHTNQLREIYRFLKLS